MRVRRYGIDECVDASDSQRGRIIWVSCRRGVSSFTSFILTKFGTSILRLSCLIGQEIVDGRDGLVIIAPMQIPPIQIPPMQDNTFAACVEE